MFPVSVVIPTYKGRHLLEAYLPSVLEATETYRSKTGCASEIVVVDDGSGDETQAWLMARYPGFVRLVAHAANLGFPEACNTGFRAARHPAVLLLNNDVRLQDDCIFPLIAHLEDARVFAATGKMYDQSGRRFCNGGKVARFRRGMWSTYENYDLLPGIPPDSPLLSFTAIGAFSAFDRAKFLEVGGFDPLVPMVEDVELSYRGWKRGWLIRYEPRAVAFHDASRTMDQVYRRRALDGLSRRSRILMHWMLLHDGPMFRRHILALAGRFLVSWMLLDGRFYWGVFTGLTHLKQIREKRHRTRQTAVRSDSDLHRILEGFYRSAPIALRRE